MIVFSPIIFFIIMKFYHLLQAVFLIVLIQTQASKQQYTPQVLLKGKNFQGEIKMYDKELTIDILDFINGEMFSSVITKEDLQVDYNRYLIFTQISDLFVELSTNKQVDISDNALLVPIDITYKFKDYKLKIKIPLERRNFQSEANKLQTLFQLIKKINEENQKINLYYPQLIHFTGDRTNQKYKMFEHSQNNRRIKMLATDQALIYNHFQTVPKKGVFYFQFKIIKSVNQSIFIGICGKNIKSNANVFLDPTFMGLYLANGNLYGHNKNIVAASVLTIVEGQSIFKVQIDMNKKVILWYLNDSLIYMRQIWKSLANKDFYPMVALHTQGDTIEFMNK